MVDPRLNSVHLEAPRRQLYRQAREGLLNARGWHTIAAESPEELEAALANPHTFVEQPLKEAPSDLKFWLLDRDHVYPLKVGINTIGRAPDNDVVLQDCYVSRRHCAIVVHTADNCELHDTASKNGTTVNGRRLAGPQRLSSGDEIRMCDRQLVFIAKSGAPPESPFHSPTLAG